MSDVKTYTVNYDIITDVSKVDAGLRTVKEYADALSTVFQVPKTSLEEINNLFSQIKSLKPKPATLELGPYRAALKSLITDVEAASEQIQFALRDAFNPGNLQPIKQNSLKRQLESLRKAKAEVEEEMQKLIGSTSRKNVGGQLVNVGDSKTTTLPSGKKIKFFDTSEFARAKKEDQERYSRLLDVHQESLDFYNKEIERLDKEYEKSRNKSAKKVIGEASLADPKIAKGITEELEKTLNKVKNSLPKVPLNFTLDSKKVNEMLKEALGTGYDIYIVPQLDVEAVNKIKSKLQNLGATVKNATSNVANKTAEEAQKNINSTIPKGQPLTEAENQKLAELKNSTAMRDLAKAKSKLTEKHRALIPNDQKSKNAYDKALTEYRNQLTNTASIRQEIQDLEKKNFQASSMRVLNDRELTQGSRWANVVSDLQQRATNTEGMSVKEVQRMNRTLRIGKENIAELQRPPVLAPGPSEAPLTIDVGLNSTPALEDLKRLKAFIQDQKTILNIKAVAETAQLIDDVKKVVNKGTRKERTITGAHIPIPVVLNTDSLESDLNAAIAKIEKRKATITTTIQFVDVNTQITKALNNAHATIEKGLLSRANKYAEIINNGGTLPVQKRAKQTVDDLKNTLTETLSKIPKSLTNLTVDVTPHFIGLASEMDKVQRFLNERPVTVFVRLAPEENKNLVERREQLANTPKRRNTRNRQAPTEPVPNVPTEPQVITDLRTTLKEGLEKTAQNMAEVTVHAKLSVDSVQTELKRIQGILDTKPVQVIVRLVPEGIERTLAQEERELAGAAQKRPTRGTTKAPATQTENRPAVAPTTQPETTPVPKAIMDLKASVEEQLKAIEETAKISVQTRLSKQFISQDIADIETLVNREPIKAYVRLSPIGSEIVPEEEKGLVKKPEGKVKTPTRAPAQRGETVTPPATVPGSITELKKNLEEQVRNGQNVTDIWFNARLIESSLSAELTRIQEEIYRHPIEILIRPIVEGTGQSLLKENERIAPKPITPPVPNATAPVAPPKPNVPSPVPTQTPTPSTVSPKAVPETNIGMVPSREELIRNNFRSLISQYTTPLEPAIPPVVPPVTKPGVAPTVPIGNVPNLKEHVGSVMARNTESLVEIGVTLNTWAANEELKLLLNKIRTLEESVIVRINDSLFNTEYDEIKGKLQKLKGKAEIKVWLSDEQIKTEIIELEKNIERSAILTLPVKFSASQVKQELERHLEILKGETLQTNLRFNPTKALTELQELLDTKNVFIKIRFDFSALNQEIKALQVELDTKRVYIAPKLKVEKIDGEVERLQTRLNKCKVTVPTGLNLNEADKNLRNFKNRIAETSESILILLNISKALNAFEDLKSLISNKSVSINVNLNTTEAEGKLASLIEKIQTCLDKPHILNVQPNKAEEKETGKDKKPAGAALAPSKPASESAKEVENAAKNAAGTAAPKQNEKTKGIVSKYTELKNAAETVVPAKTPAPTTSVQPTSEPVSPVVPPVLTAQQRNQEIAEKVTKVTALGEALAKLKDINVQINVLTEEAYSKLNAFIDTYQGKTITVKLQAETAPAALIKEQLTAAQKPIGEKPIVEQPVSETANKPKTETTKQVTPTPATQSVKNVQNAAEKLAGAQAPQPEKPQAPSVQIPSKPVGITSEPIKNPEPEVKTPTVTPPTAITAQQKTQETAGMLSQITAVEEAIARLKDKQIDIKVNALTAEAKTELDTFINKYEGKTINVNLKAIIPPPAQVEETIAAAQRAQLTAQKNVGETPNITQPAQSTESKTKAETQRPIVPAPATQSVRDIQNTTEKITGAPASQPKEQIQTPVSTPTAPKPPVTSQTPQTPQRVNETSTVSPWTTEKLIRVVSGNAQVGEALDRQCVDVDLNIANALQKVEELAAKIASLTNQKVKISVSTSGLNEPQPPAKMPAGTNMSGGYIPKVEPIAPVEAPRVNEGYSTPWPGHRYVRMAKPPRIYSDFNLLANPPISSSNSKALLNEGYLNVGDGIAKGYGFRGSVSEDLTRPGYYESIAGYPAPLSIAGGGTLTSASQKIPSSEIPQNMVPNKNLAPITPTLPNQGVLESYWNKAVNQSQEIFGFGSNITPNVNLSPALSSSTDSYPYSNLTEAEQQLKVRVQNSIAAKKQKVLENRRDYINRAQNLVGDNGKLLKFVRDNQKSFTAASKTLGFIPTQDTTTEDKVRYLDEAMKQLIKNGVTPTTEFKNLYQEQSSILEAQKLEASKIKATNLRREAVKAVPRNLSFKDMSFSNKFSFIQSLMNEYNKRGLSTNKLVELHKKTKKDQAKAEEERIKEQRHQQLVEATQEKARLLAQAKEDREKKAGVQKSIASKSRTSSILKGKTINGLLSVTGGDGKLAKFITENRRHFINVAKQLGYTADPKTITNPIDRQNHLVSQLSNLSHADWANYLQKVMQSLEASGITPPTAIQNEFKKSSAIVKARELNRMRGEAVQAARAATGLNGSVSDMSLADKEAFYKGLMKEYHSRGIPVEKLLKTYKKIKGALQAEQVGATPTSTNAADQLKEFVSAAQHRSKVDISKLISSEHAASWLRFYDELEKVYAENNAKMPQEMMSQKRAKEAEWKSWRTERLTRIKNAVSSYVGSNELRNLVAENWNTFYRAAVQNQIKSLEDFKHLNSQAKLKFLQDVKNRIVKEGRKEVPMQLEKEIQKLQAQISGTPQTPGTSGSRGGGNGGGTIPPTGKSGRSNYEKPVYDKARKWAYPFSGQTSFGVRTPMMVDMAKGMGVMFAVGGAMSAISESFSQAMEYQNTMETTKAILQHGTDTYSATNFKNMEHIIRDVGVKTKFSAPEVASAARFLAMAGLNIEDINNSIRPIADIALIGDTDLGETADKMTNIMTIFGINSKHMRQVANILTTTATRSNTDLMMLAEAAHYGGGVANMYGKNDPNLFADTMALFGVMGNAGIQGSSAGTGLRMMYQNIFNPNKKQKKILDNLEKKGIRTKNADGSFRSMAEFIRDIANNITDQNEMATIVSNLFRITAQPAANATLMAAVNGNIDEYNDVIKKYGKIEEDLTKKGGMGKLAELMEANRNAIYGNISSSIAEEKQNTVTGLMAQLTSTFTEGIVKAFESRKGELENIVISVRDYLARPEIVTMLHNLLDLIVDIGGIMGDFVKVWANFYHTFPGAIKLWMTLQMVFTQFGYLLSPFVALLGVVNRIGGVLKTAVGGRILAKAGTSAAVESGLSNAVLLTSAIPMFSKRKDKKRELLPSNPITPITTYNMGNTYMGNPSKTPTPPFATIKYRPSLVQGMESMAATAMMGLTIGDKNEQIKKEKEEYNKKIQTKAKERYGWKRGWNNIGRYWGLKKNKDMISSVISVIPTMLSNIGRWILGAVHSITWVLGLLISPLGLLLTAVTALGFGIYKVNQLFEGQTEAQRRAFENTQKLADQAHFEREKHAQWLQGFMEDPDSEFFKKYGKGLTGYATLSKKGEATLKYEAMMEARKLNYAELYDDLTNDVSHQRTVMAAEKWKNSMMDNQLSRLALGDNYLEDVKDTLNPVRNTEFKGKNAFLMGLGAKAHYTWGGGDKRNAQMVARQQALDMVKAEGAYDPIVQKAIEEAEKIQFQYLDNKIEEAEYIKQMKEIQDKYLPGLDKMKLINASDLTTEQLINYSDLPSLREYQEGVYNTLKAILDPEHRDSIFAYSNAVRKLTSGTIEEYSEKWKKYIGDILNNSTLETAIHGANDKLERMKIQLRALPNGNIDVDGIIRQVQATLTTYQKNLQDIATISAGVYKMLVDNGFITDGSVQGAEKYISDQLNNQVSKGMAGEYFDKYLAKNSNWKGTKNDFLSWLFGTEEERNTPHYSRLTGNLLNRQKTINKIYHTFISDTAASVMGANNPTGNSQSTDGSSNTGDGKPNPDGKSNPNDGNNPGGGGLLSSLNQSGYKPNTSTAHEVKQVTINFNGPIAQFSDTNISSSAEENDIMMAMEEKMANTVLMAVTSALGQINV